MIGIFKINLGNNQPKLRQKIRIIYFRIVTIGKNPHLWNSVFTTLVKQWHLGKSVSGNSPILFSEGKPGQAWLCWLEFEGPPQKVAKLLPASAVHGARIQIPLVFQEEMPRVNLQKCVQMCCQTKEAWESKPRQPRIQARLHQETMGQNWELGGNDQVLMIWAILFLGGV